MHLTSYPEENKSQIDEALEAQIDCVIRTKNLGLGLRNQAKVRARQPLSTLTVRPRDAADRAVLEESHFAAQVLEEVNVERLALIDDESAMVKVKLVPDFKKLGPRLGKKMKAVAARLAQADAGEVRAALERGGWAVEVDGETVELGPGDVEVRLEGQEGMAVAEANGAFAALDTRITPALERAGIARDFNRQAQEQRKEAGLHVSDRVRITFSASPRIAEAVHEHAGFLAGELLADAIEEADAADGAEVKVGGEKVRLAVSRA